MISTCTCTKEQEEKVDKSAALVSQNHIYSMEIVFVLNTPPSLKLSIYAVTERLFKSKLTFVNR